MKEWVLVNFFFFVDDPDLESTMIIVDKLSVIGMQCIMSWYCKVIHVITDQLNIFPYWFVHNLYAGPK